MGWTQLKSYFPPILTQQDIGRLAFSIVRTKRTRLLPSGSATFQGFCGPPPGLCIWPGEEAVSMEALWRGVRGQTCRYHMLSPLVHCPELHPMAAPGCKDAGAWVFLGELRKERRLTCIGKHWAFSVTPDNCQHGCRCDKRNSREKNPQNKWMLFLKGDAEYFYMSIIFKVILCIYNFNV